MCFLLDSQVLSIAQRSTLFLAGTSMTDGNLAPQRKNGYRFKMCYRSYTAITNVYIFLLFRLFTAILIGQTIISREEEGAHYKESDSKLKRAVQASSLPN